MARCRPDSQCLQAAVGNYGLAFTTPPLVESYSFDSSKATAGDPNGLVVVSYQLSMSVPQADLRKFTPSSLAILRTLAKSQLMFRSYGECNLSLRLVCHLDLVPTIKKNKKEEESVYL